MPANNPIEERSNTANKLGEPKLGPQEEACGPSPPMCGLSTASDSINMHLSAMNLLLWLTLLTSPCCVYWIKNVRHSIQLDPDPVRMLAITLIFTVEILMNSTVSSLRSSKLLKMTARLQLPFSVLVVVFGQLHLYRVAYFITLSLFLHALSCFI
ncbi:hypothetical protein GDO78_014676 [Eleutherodactylus coqui]|uniref:GPI inositol-deacylase transmembrane domain-containing protein n=1 Tax=Eleutherodactylus coqui TaxID=57060 RepID=A0A8J6ELL5_ELECQ|nr:hypothetical protein GDO78_014676 [Eleutherodactylus coqui]